MSTGGSKLRVLAQRLRVTRPLIREAFAEGLGTFVLVLFGCGSVAQMVFRGPGVPFLSVNLAFGLAVTMGCYIAGGVSGAHLNPAVSLAMVVLGRLTLLKMLVYWVAQLVGAFLGAAMVFLIYLDAEKKHSKPWSMETAGIYATYPGPHLSTGGGFFDQVMGTAALLLCILALLDKKNSAPPDGVTPLIVGLVVTVIGMAMGHNCGYAINPARDLGPRLFTLIAGWGRPVFTHRNYWFWVPITAPFLGGVLGALTYVLFVELHHPSSSDSGTNTKEDTEKHYDLRKFDSHAAETVA
uniref:aquaporin-3-like n=1 Tax=Myxine glutinosa TaxID=7769 RepID=UPI00358E013C